jgi:hypothetical protein
MDVSVRVSVLVFFCVGGGLATGRCPIQGIIPTVCKIHIFQINSEMGPDKGSDPLKKDKVYIFLCNNPNAIKY